MDGTTQYTVTVKFAGAGTPLSSGGTSKFGHVWFETRSSNGETNSYGWSTGSSAFLGGRDNIEYADSSKYLGNQDNPVNSITAPITKEQYERLNSFPDRAANGQVKGFHPTYDLLTNSCIDFAAKALADAGLAGSNFEGGYLWPSAQLDSFLNEMNNNKDGWLLLNRDGKYHVYDPLVLDLDGDGIETVGTQGYNGALFDHNSDGIRTATGWVSADDGLLVIDRNGDGVINDGAELFSDSYTLSDCIICKIDDLLLAA